MIEIFRRLPGQLPVRVEAVDNLSRAIGRLVALCASHPGHYFAASRAEVLAQMSSYHPAAPGTEASDSESSAR